MKKTSTIFSFIPKMCRIIFLCVLIMPVHWANAQAYRVENGKMVIEIPKNINLQLFGNFIQKFNLGDIGLSELIHKGIKDSLLLLGWQVSENTEGIFSISKPFESSSAFNNPEGKLIISMHPQGFEQRFPRVPEGLRGGTNNFKPGSEFMQKDSIVHFYLDGHSKASRVFLAGSFNNWRPQATAMKSENDGWGIDVKLLPGKYWYKFIVDGNWITDSKNRIRENDGEGNTNSVYYMSNHRFTLQGYTEAKKVNLSGSFNYWQQWPMHKTEQGWQLDVFLSEGSHTYRFVVDGNWMDDPANPQKLPNEFGEFNSLLAIGNPMNFRLLGFQNASRVTLTGNFNEWKENELILERKNDGWETNYVLGPGNYWYRYLVDGKPTIDTSGVFTPGTKEDPAANLLIIDPNYNFVLRGYNNAKTVALAGDFNGFNVNNFLMHRKGDTWITEVHLSAGKHIYKFIVDGVWIRDPDNPQWEQNDFNTGNSVIWVEPHAMPKP